MISPVKVYYTLVYQKNQEKNKEAEASLFKIRVQFFVFKIIL